MKNKENLLSLEEPLQFIFSHSALREGWDNPNVFQILYTNWAERVRFSWFAPESGERSRSVYVTSPANQGVTIPPESATLPS